MVCLIDFPCGFHIGNINQTIRSDLMKFYLLLNSVKTIVLKKQITITNKFTNRLKL